jgi:hypothetical protein
MGLTQSLAVILQGTIVTQASVTIPNPFLLVREAHIQKCTLDPSRYNKHLSWIYFSIQDKTIQYPSN